MLNLDHQKVIVTGATKGIGRAIATKFASCCSHLHLVSRTSHDLQKLATLLLSNKCKVTWSEADLSRPEEVANIAANLGWDRVDALIHNAGIYPEHRLETMTSDDWKHVLSVNLDSAFYLTKEFLPLIKKSEHGRILFTSSISGPQVALPGYSHYTTSKAGLQGFIKTAAVELAKYNITVNSVEPGNIWSEGFEEMGEEHKKRMIAAIPLGRLGKAEEIANFFLFLASPLSGYMTGQSIVVDGGQVLPESHYLEF